MAADALKQRLVGGATLLLVGAIAWFWLLSADSPVDPVARESQIPPAPDIQPFAVQEPVRPQNIEPIGSARESEAALQSDAVPRPAPAPKPVVSAAPPPKPAQAAAAPKVDAAKVGATHSAVGKSNAAAATAVASAPQKPAPLKSPAAATKTAEPEAKAKDTRLTPETFQLDQRGLPIAWVVQVGLFSSQASADKIKATLQEKGFKAYTEPFKSEKASGIKVFVGPKLSRERADAQKKAIDDALKTNSMVVRFVAN